MHRRIPILLLASLVACSGQRKKPETKSEPAAETGLPGDPGAPLPLNPKVKEGVLQNGLTYYVRENKKPEKRAELWLVVDAGSFHEDDDQRGLAHFVEHMAFNGTTSFPKNELLSALQKLGVKFGPHVNAETTFDHTAYKLRVPTDDPEAIDLAIKVLAEWASEVTFLPGDLDAERGVVLAEKRGKQGPEMRMLETLVQQVFAGSRYASRIPIGDPEIIKTATPETLRRFYRDWYHPKNMAVLAVGDFDGAAIEKKLRETFASLKAPEKVRPQPARAIPKRSEALVLALQDKEMPISGVLVGRVLPARGRGSASDLRRGFVEGVAAVMISKRLEEARQNGSARYLMAAGGPAPLVRAADGFGFFAAVKPGEMKAGLEDLCAELERARRHGFVASELDRARREVIARLESTVKEAAADRESSTALVSELVRHHLTGEAMPGRAAELELVKHFAGTVSLEELQAVVTELLSARDLVVASIAPAGASVLARDDVLAVLSALPEKQLVAYTDVKSNEPLMATPPAPGKVTGRRHHRDIDAHEWTLSNGARVVLKPTRFQQDEILVRAVSPGGLSLSPVEDLRKTFAAAEIVRRGGLGTFDATALEKSLAGRRVSVLPFIAEHSEGLTASSTSDDLEVMMQLVHLSFQAPRMDPDSFAIWKESQLEQVKLASNKPETRFARRLSRLASNKNPRSLLWTEELVGATDLRASYALYRDRMQDASDFTFVIVGSFDLEGIEPLVTRYLASLPDIDRTEEIEIHEWPVHDRRRQLVVRDGQTRRAQIVLGFSRDIDAGAVTASDRVAWDLFGDALELQLLDLFREQLGETYSVSATTGFRERWSYATLQVALQCDPGRAKKLEARLLAEIEKAVARGVDPGYLSKARQGAIKTLESDLESNGYWRDRLSQIYLNGWKRSELTGRKAAYEKLTAAAIAEVARKLVDPKKPVIGVLLPERD